MRDEIKKVASICGAWLVLGVVLWLVLPEQLKWIAYISVMVLPAAFAITGAIILLRRIPVFKNLFAPRVAIIRGRTVTACYLCPYRFLKDNPVNKSYPIVKCEDKEMKINYTPDKVPRWCPYVSK
jgi:hypothetical protein